MASDSSGVGVPSVRLEVRLLGVVEVVLDGRRLRAFDSLRLQRFLALIALRGGPQHRSRLAFELWPDSNERQARTNLRKLLHELRHALPSAPEFIEIDNEIVRWIPAGASAVDVLRFREAAASGNLELAARLYTGDLLPACYDNWVLDERARLRVEAHAALKRLTEEAAGRSDPGSVINHAQRTLDLVPTDEGAAQALMEAHSALGDRAAALRAYHRYVDILDRELEVAPGDEIRQLYQRIRTDAVSPAQREDAVRGPVAESPFIGRDLEIDRLYEAWRTCLHDGAHLVLVTGEPGIGKSRLASELGRRVRAEGHAATSVRAYEAAGRPPWGPIVDLLRADTAQRHIGTLEPVWRAELGRLLPELLAVEGPGGEKPGGEVAQRHRILDAVSRAVTAEGRPHLIVIDDLQWCDAETIESIGFIVNSGRETPVLIVGTVRPEEVGQDHPLVGLVEALGHDQAVTTVPLDRFDQATTGALAALLRTEGTVDPTSAARLWSETEGNPLFIIEAHRAGVSSDRQSALTPTIRAVLRARLSQLSEGARRLAEVAAVVGRPFSVQLLASVTGIDENELVDDIDELWSRRIVRDQGLTYDFSHDKLRTVALEMVSPARRRLLHRAVAEAIMVDAGDDLEAGAPQVAAHFDQAGMVRPAIDAYRRAGSRAVAVSALEEAVTMLKRALALLAELPPSSARDALELEIRIALGSPLVALAGYGSKEAHQLYERGQALCRRLRRPVDPPILRGLGLARLQGCRFDDSSAMGRALLVGDGHDAIARTEGRYLLGVSAFWQGDLSGARRYLGEALDGYDLSHRDRHLALFAQDPRGVCLVRLALADLWAGDPGRADEGARSAIELATDLDHLMTLAYVLTYAAILSAEAGDLSRLSELLGEAELLWQRHQERYLRVVLEGLRGWMEVREGSATGIDRIVEAVSASRAEGETLHLTYTLLLLARARGEIGELHPARAATREGLSWSHRFNQGYLEAELWRVDGELAFRSGDGEAATTSLDEAVRIAQEQGAAWLEVRALHSLASRSRDPATLERLRDLMGTIPSGRDLPPLRAASALLNETG